MYLQKHTFERFQREVNFILRKVENNLKTDQIYNN